MTTTALSRKRISQCFLSARVEFRSSADNLFRKIARESRENSHNSPRPLPFFLSLHYCCARKYVTTFTLVTLLLLARNLDAARDEDREITSAVERQHGWILMNRRSIHSPNMKFLFSSTLSRSLAETSGEGKAFCYVYTNQPYSWIPSFDSPQEIIRISCSVAWNKHDIDINLCQLSTMDPWFSVNQESRRKRFITPTREPWRPLPIFLKYFCEYFCVRYCVSTGKSRIW